MSTRKKPTQVRDSNVKKCNICANTFSNLSNLKRHYQNKHLLSYDEVIRIYKCDLCVKDCSFSSKRSMESHFILCHLPRKWRFIWVKCKVCNKKFSSKYLFSKHRKLTLHKESNTLYKCGYCGSLFTKISHLERHTRNEHNINPIEIPTSSEQSLNSEQSCHICKKVFARKFNLRRHLKTGHGYEAHPELRCQLCNRPYFDREKLQRHMQLKHLTVDILMPSEVAEISLQPCTSGYNNTQASMASGSSQQGDCSMLVQPISALDAIPVLLPTDTLPGVACIIPIEKPADAIASRTKKERCIKRNCRKSVIKLTLQVRRLQAKLRRCERKNNMFKQNISKILNSDQITYLERRSDANPFTWSDETVSNALCLKSTVGTKSYEQLRKLRWPLPAARTLRQRVERFKFLPGIQTDIIDLLGTKLKSENEINKASYLEIIEIDISQTIEHCKSLGCNIGSVDEVITIDTDLQKPARKCVIFIGRGVCLSWTQIVAYFFTTLVDTQKLWNLLQKVMLELYARDITVRAISTNMKTSNIVSFLNIQINQSSIPHPANDSLSLFVIPNSHQILKNIELALKKCDFYLPNGVMEKFGLPTRIVSYKYIIELLEIQKCGGPILVEKMSTKKPKCTRKKNIRLMTNIVSSEMAIAMNEYIKIGLLPKDSTTTAWFLKLIGDWFAVMKTRMESQQSQKCSIEDKLTHLMCIMDIMKCLKFSINTRVMSFPNDIILITQCTLNLYEEFGTSSSILPYYEMTNKLFPRIITKSGTKCHPSAIKVRRRLTLFFNKKLSNIIDDTSSELHNSKFVLDFAKSCQNRENRGESDVLVPKVTPVILYRLAGCVARQVSLSLQCAACRDDLVTKNADLTHIPPQCVEIFTRTGLAHPTLQVVELFKKTEEHFPFIGKKTPQKKKLVEWMIESCIPIIRSENRFDYVCFEHPTLVNKLLDIYLTVRVHMRFTGKNQLSSAELKKKLQHPKKNRITLKKKPNQAKITRSDTIVAKSLKIPGMPIVSNSAPQSIVVVPPVTTSLIPSKKPLNLTWEPLSIPASAVGQSSTEQYFIINVGDNQADGLTST